jgi:lipase chaperone LimK
MNFIKECFEEHDGALVDQLKGAGFSDYRAKQFLPEAATGILDSSQDTSVEQMTEQMVSGAPSQFLNSVNVEVIAEKLGMNSDQVTKGLAAITPVLAREFSQESDYLFGALTSLAPGLFKRFS